MFRKLLYLCLFALALWGCAQALQRGMLGNAYISTARPAISLQVKDQPLMAAGEATCNLDWTGMLGGLPIQTWTAVYGEGGLAPLALVMQAQTPSGWYWDGITPRVFSVDQGTAAFGGVTYDAWTYIVDPARDPFGGFITGVQPDGQPQLWIGRMFSARYNFNFDKIILEYREPLPAGITNLTSLPMGHDSLLREFARRAQAAFVVGPPPQDTAGVRKSYMEGVRWEYMGQNFLGSVSRNDFFNFN